MPYIGNASANRFVASKAASVFSGNGSNQEFTLDHAVGSDEDILVSVDGVIQEPSVAYAVSNGTTLTFTAAPSNNSGNNIFVYYLFRTVGTVSHPSNNALQASDITVDTTTLVTDSTNNRVGIGTASPHADLHIQNQTGTNTGSTELNLWVNDDRGRSKFNLKSTDDGTSIGTFKLTTESTVPSNTDLLIMNSQGMMTIPNQPAFNVNNSNASQTSFAVGALVDVVFGVEVFDQNADFASNVFTAPITGRYQFNVNCRLDDMDSASSYYLVRLVTSNRNYTAIFDSDEFGSDLNYFTMQVSCLADMDASDTAKVIVYQNNGTQQTAVIDDSYFTGYLVC